MGPDDITLYLKVIQNFYLCNECSFYASVLVSSLFRSQLYVDTLSLYKVLIAYFCSQLANLIQNNYICIAFSRRICTLMKPTALELLAHKAEVLLSILVSTQTILT